MHTGSDIVAAANLADLPPAVASMFAAVAEGSKNYPPIGSASRSARLERVARAGAWTEAALALLELELPNWHVRRLEQDDHEWYCTLSRHPRAPREFDDSVDGRGPSLALAILDALLEAHQRSLSEEDTQPPADGGPTRTEVVWCENVR
ncbi:MAG TPA: hypothetical protein VIN06_11650 [Devosia sp.]